MTQTGGSTASVSELRYDFVALGLGTWAGVGAEISGSVTGYNDNCCCGSGTTCGCGNLQPSFARDT
eukprot:607729-Prymnesium_polylepis.1